jgi:chromosome segregation ATPase
MNLRPLLLATLTSTLLLSPALLPARSPMPQQDGESVADAARKAKAQKKQNAKPPAVLTNDTIDTLKGTVSVVGEEPAPAVDETKTPQDKAAPVDKKPAPAKDETYWRQQFTNARKKLADDAHELDILQREYNLKQQQYYSDPNTAMREQYTRQDLTDTKTKIDDKTAAVEQDKQALSDLEDALRAAGGDAGWSREQ